ncbi:MAG: ATP-binding protein [Candidatus Omnitrophota bacterium]
MTKEDLIYHPQIPKLNLPGNEDILSDFVTEALSYLMSGENALFTLETVSGDPGSIQNLFKIFHTLRGLTGFLNLEDIQSLSQEAEGMIDDVRKGHLSFDRDIMKLTSEIINGLRKLLSLLNEQIIQKGTLKSEYYDVGPLIQKVVCIRQKNIPVEQKNDGAAQQNTQEPQSELIQDKEDADKTGQRQRDLIEERDFAIQLSKQSQGAARLKGNLLASLAHDIRALTASILGFSNMLQTGQLNVKQHDQVNNITLSATLLLGIVNNILDFAKVESGKFELENVSFDLNVIIDEISRIFLPRFEGKSTRLYFNIDDDVPANLIGDPVRLKQILINLLDNAIKFTQKGEIRLMVRREPQTKEDVKKDECVLRFAVSDTGIGIPEDKKEIIFDAFTQVDASTSRQYGGTGLGLSICKNFVNLLGGHIWVDSQIGSGSTFAFTIKLEISEFKKEKAKIAAEEKKVQQRYAELEKISCQGIKVLVAEDSITNQELIAAYFEQFGCEGDFVSNGQEALEKIKNIKYDLCIIDLQMPVLDGIEATRIIRKDLKLDVPIMALTAADSKEEKELCYTVGMNDYISKPFDMYDLKEKIIKLTKS